MWPVQVNVPQDQLSCWKRGTTLSDLSKGICMNLGLCNKAGAQEVFMSLPSPSTDCYWINEKLKKPKSKLYLMAANKPLNKERRKNTSVT